MIALRTPENPYATTKYAIIVRPRAWFLSDIAEALLGTPHQAVVLRGLPMSMVLHLFKDGALAFCALFCWWWCGSGARKRGRDTRNDCIAQRRSLSFGEGGVGLGVGVWGEDRS